MNIKKISTLFIPLLLVLTSCNVDDPTIINPSDGSSDTSQPGTGSSGSGSGTSSGGSGTSSGGTESGGGSSGDSGEDTPIPLSFKFGIAGEEAILLKVIGSDTEITIPGTYEGKPVTRIGESAFSGLTKLRTVVIPENVKEIGVSAFNSLTNLINITFPSSLRTIGNYAFANLPYITSLTLPEGLEEIGGSVFSSCRNLKNISLPSSLRSIGGNLFSGDEKLKYTTYEGVDYLGNETNPYLLADKLNEDNTSPTSVSFHNDTKIVGGSLLESEASVTAITLNEGLVTISGSAFRGTSITEITIPSSVKEIANYAFESCTKLTTCTIEGNGLETIEHEAFTGASALKTINIPSSVKEIGFYAFNKFDDASSLQYNIKDGGKYLGNTENPYYAFIGLEDNSATSFSLNESTVLMAGQCLRDAKNIASFTIPNTVKYIGSDAFFQMTSLTSIVVPSTVETMGEGLFDSCKALTSVTLNNSPVELGDAFVANCDQLATFTIPSSVKKIGKSVFLRDTSLSMLVIPSSVVEIASGAIASSSNLSLFIEADKDLDMYEKNWFNSVSEYYYGESWSYVDGTPTPNK